MKTIKELRDSIVLVIAMAEVDYITRRNAGRDLDTLIELAKEEGRETTNRVYRTRSPEAAHIETLAEKTKQKEFSRQRHL